MLNALSDETVNLSTREGEAYESQFSTRDYGRVGDQRPFQIVFPAYPAPKFLSRFAYLRDALRECGTLCQLTGKPFRLVKWGARVPCYPCRGKNTLNRLPSVRIHSPGALAGFPDAVPVADFRPNTGTLVYGPDGQPKIVGAPNFVVSSSPFPRSELARFPVPLMPLRYAQAVKTAQFLASTTGRNAFLCSSMGANCNTRNPKDWVPVIYVQPGGLVRRYHTDLALPNSPKGSTVATTDVSENDFRELVRQSAGASQLPWGT
jgi:hypothetical protein